MFQAIWNSVGRSVTVVNSPVFSISGVSYRVGVLSEKKEILDARREGWRVYPPEWKNFQVDGQVPRNLLN